MKSTIQDREFAKFRDGETGDAVAVTFDGEAIPVETGGVIWDEIVTTFPAANQDLFTYKKESQIVQTVLVTYENDSKKIIVGINKTRF
jgi:hypothetical protein